MSFSDHALEQFETETADDPFLCLLTIDHADLEAPLRIVSNTDDIESRGDTYVGLPFEFERPGDGVSGPTVARLIVDNVHRDIVIALRTLTTPPTITVEGVFASAPDDPEVSIANLTLRDASYDATRVTGTLRMEDLDVEPIAELITPDRFPGCF